MAGKKTTENAVSDLPDELLACAERCRKELQEIGLVLRGTVIERYMPCGKKACRCHADPPSLHGPYHQWTTKVGGKTRTVSLTPEQAHVYAAWIANGRRLNELVRRWAEAGSEAAELIRR